MSQHIVHDKTLARIRKQTPSKRLALTRAAPANNDEALCVVLVVPLGSHWR